MKQSFLLTFFILLFVQVTGQTINTGIFGQNANLTATVGTNTTAGGHLDEYWDRYGTYSGQDYIYESKVKYMRYGGIQVEEDCEIDGIVGTSSNLDATIADYINKAKAMQENDIEPMLTLPLKYNTGSGPIFSVNDAADQAALLVYEVNTTLAGLGGVYKPVVYWVYSNEPDGGAHGYTGTDAAQKIHDYIVAYYNAVTGIWDSGWDTEYVGPQFVGPELRDYNNYTHGGGCTRLIEQLLGQYNQNDATTGAEDDNDITPYISVFSWHYYPFNDESVYDAFIPEPDRSNTIDILSSGAPRPGGGMTASLLANIQQIKGWLPPGIKLGITEANICYINDVNASYITDDLVTGNGANGYIAGQFWAEMMGICMKEEVSFLNFWSSIEGCSSCTTNPYDTNVGFLNTNTSTGALGDKKSTYHHFKMVAEHMKGSYCEGSACLWMP